MNIKKSEEKATLLNDCSTKARLRGRFQDLMKGDYELSTREQSSYLSQYSQQKTKRSSSKGREIFQESPSHVNEGYSSENAESPHHQTAVQHHSTQNSFYATTQFYEEPRTSSTPKPYPANDSTPDYNRITRNKHKSKHHSEQPSTSKTTEEIQDLENTDNVKMIDKSYPSPSNVPTKKKSEKKKKKRALPNCPGNEDENAISTSDNLEIEATNNESEAREEILGIVVHQASKLKTHVHISHPVVQIHIMNLETGSYLSKLNNERPVSSFYENQHGNVDYIMPVMTQPCKSFNPMLPNLVWEELVVFNEDFKYFSSEDPRVIIFFEIIDFVSPSDSNYMYPHPKPEDGWYRIAWAFLVLRSSNGVLHISKKVQLQLFRLPTHKLCSENMSAELYKWWKSGLRNPIDAKLMVTVKPILPPENIEPSTRSLLPMQQEYSKGNLENISSPKTGTLKNTSHMSPQAKEMSEVLTEWSRFPGQACKIPTQCFLNFSTNNGCLALQFSHNGRSLACGIVQTNSHDIVIYQIPSGILLCHLRNHNGLIYDLDWADDDSLLLSASADGTARLWNVVQSVSVAILPHPCFVYSAKFHPLTSTIIVTGSFDKLLRIWYVSLDDQVTFELLQELSDHESHINDICWDYQSSRLFSADNGGCLIVWNSLPNQHLVKNGDKIVVEWQLEKKIALREIKGIPINCINLHPSGRKILLHCRDSVLRLLDVNSEVVIRQYVGIVNFQYLLRSSFSPCGTLITCGSEDGTVYIWYSDTGQKAKVYTDLPFKGPVTCVKYHPHDNIIAMCAGKQKSPILVYGRQKKGKDVQSSPARYSQLHVNESSVWHNSITRGAEEKQETSRYHTEKETRNLEPSLTFNAAVEKTIRLQRIAAKLDSVLHVEKNGH